MRMSDAVKEAAGLIRRYVAAQAEDWEWNVFEAVPAEDAQVETLRQQVLAIAQQFPARSPSEWCSPEGMDALRSMADRILGGGEEDALVVKDSNGTTLQDGDSVTLIKDLPVKGANVTLKRGTMVKNIRLTTNPAEIECNADKVKGLVLRTEFLKKA